MTKKEYDTGALLGKTPVSRSSPFYMERVPARIPGMLENWLFTVCLCRASACFWDAGRDRDEPEVATSYGDLYRSRSGLIRSIFEVHRSL